MIIVGLTGGIAAGKSAASNILRQWEIPVIDADIIAREVVKKGEPILERIKEAFGEKVINEDGTLNRKQLGKIVFNSQQELIKLNNIIHPRIIEEIINKIEVYRLNTNCSILIIDAALLIEMDMARIVDEVWLVMVDEKTQLERLMKRDNISCEEAMNRIKSQMSTEEKIEKAHVIINNNKDLKHLENQLSNQICRLKSGLTGGI